MIRFALISLLCVFAAHAAEPFAPADWWMWREILEARIRPDASTVAWTESFHDRAADSTCSNLWMAATTGGEPHRLTDGAWRDTSPRWSPDSRHLAFVSNRTGIFAATAPQIWVRGFMDSRVRQITRLDSPPLAIAWSPDSTAVAYTANLPDETPDMPWAPPDLLPLLRRAAPRAGLFVVPVGGGATVRIPIGKLNVIGEPAWVADGKSILISAAEPGGDPEIFAVPLSLAGARQITHHPGPDISPVPSPDGSRIAWIARDALRQNYVTSKLYVANHDGSRAKVLAGALDRDVTHLQWSSDSRTVYFLAEDHGATRVWAARADGNVRQVTTARERLYDFSLADNGRAAVVRSPGEIVTFPVDVAGAPAKLAAPNTALLSSRKTGAAEEIQFPSAGRTIQGWIVKPPDFDRTRQYPLLIDAQDAPRRMCGVEFSLRAQIFAARGFVVLCANPRGTPGYGEEFGNLLRTRNPGDDFDDLIRGVDHLVAQGFIDPARVHIVGGMLTAWAIGHSERFRSVVAVDPVVAFAGDTGLDVQLSPLFFADKFKTPALVVDTGVSSGAATLYAALQARRVESALVTVPDPHKPSRRILAIEATLGWLTR